MDEDAERALEQEQNRQLNYFAKEHIWTDEEWDLIQRALLDNTTEEILSMSGLSNHVLGRLRLDYQISAPWEPNVPSEDTVIRRYRSFGRLRSILEDSSLWFSRIDVLEDHFEGMFPQPDIDYLKEINKQQREDQGENIVETQKWEQEVRSERIEKANKRTYVNCWRWGTDESAVFWNAYIGEDLGVAIETTVRQFRKAVNKEVSHRLLESIRAKKKARLREIDSTYDDGHNWRNLRDLIENLMIIEHSKMQIGSVEYIDFENDAIPDSRYARFFHKRKDFENEKEFRALFECPLSDLDSETRIDPDGGKKVNVDTNELISRVILKPDAPDWFETRVKTTLDHHGVDAEVERSDLDKEHPNYGLTIFPSVGWNGSLVDLDNPDEYFDY